MTTIRIIHLIWKMRTDGFGFNTEPFRFRKVASNAVYIMERMGEIQYYFYGKKAEAISIRPLWHRKVTRSFRFSHQIQALL